MVGRPALTIRRIVSVAAAALLITGCGFQLRGTSPVPLAVQPLAVQCERGVPESLCRSLKTQLSIGGVQLAPDGDAGYRLTLSDFEQTRRATAITTRAAAAEYSLTQTVQMALVSPDQIPLIANTPVTARQSYRYDEANVLAKQREQEEIERQLNDQLSQQILFRLAPLTKDRIEAIRQAHPASAEDADSRAP